MPRPHGAQRRRGLQARGNDVPTAAGEAAALARLYELGHGARDGLEPDLVRGRGVDARDRADQALRVGMARPGEE